MRNTIFQLKSKIAAMYFELCQNLKLFFSQFAVEYIENRTVLVTLKALDTRNLSKILILEFKSYCEV